MSGLNDSKATIKSLSEVTADKIIKFIVEKGLEKGDKLDNEKTLCEELEVGRSTLREAVRMLASRNILSVKHGSGIYVSDKLGLAEDPFGFTFIKDKNKLALDLLDFRRMIEPQICARAAMHATDQEISCLEEIASDVEQMILSDLPHFKDDARFHSLIGEMSRNCVMPKIEPIIINAIGVFIDTTKSVLRDGTISDHRNIIKAIKAHDPVKAADAMLLHIIHNREVIDHY